MYSRKTSGKSSMYGSKRGSSRTKRQPRDWRRRRRRRRRQRGSSRDQRCSAFVPAKRKPKKWTLRAPAPRTPGWHQSVLWPRNAKFELLCRRGGSISIHACKHMSNIVRTASVRKDGDQSLQKSDPGRGITSETPPDAGWSVLSSTRLESSSSAFTKIPSTSLSCMRNGLSARRTPTRAE